MSTTETNGNNEIKRRDIGGMIISGVFILIGALSLEQATEMTEFESAVFPATVMVAGMIFAILTIIRCASAPDPDVGKKEPGSLPRTVGLVLTMLGSALVIPFVGFFVASLLIFGGLIMISMFEPWTTGRKIVYPLVGLAIAYGVYALFRFVLLVPLPEFPV
jgi:putative tricarboxylic transport membrane protein